MWDACPVAAQGAGHAVLSEGRESGQNQPGGHRQNSHVSHSFFPLATDWLASGSKEALSGVFSSLLM